MNEIPEFIGLVIRWGFVFKCNKKKMDEMHNENYDEERHKDFIVGLIFLIIIIGLFIIYQLWGNVLD